MAWIRTNKVIKIKMCPGKNLNLGHLALQDNDTKVRDRVTYIYVKDSLYTNITGNGNRIIKYASHRPGLIARMLRSYLHLLNRLERWRGSNRQFRRSSSVVWRSHSYSPQKVRAEDSRERLRTLSWPVRVPAELRSLNRREPNLLDRWRGSFLHQRMNRRRSRNGGQN